MGEIAQRDEPFSVVVARRPEFEQLCIPRPCCEVRTPDGNSGTAGVDSGGEESISAAPESSAVYFRIGSTAALITMFDASPLYA